jgi:integrase
VPLEQISALLGHSSIRVTWEIYLHPKEDFTDAYVDVIDAD